MGEEFILDSFHGWLKSWMVAGWNSPVKWMLDALDCLQLLDPNGMALNRRPDGSTTPAWPSLGLFTAALLALGTAGCRVARPDAYPLGLYSVGSETNLAEISRAGFNLVTGPARRGFLERPRPTASACWPRPARTRGIVSTRPRSGPPWPGTIGTRRCGRGMIDEPDMQACRRRKSGQHTGS
ncbi:MAG: hypothetical protein CM1200mP34_3180 [Verrucomicrobiales bacterium]|nr:MAG: hypothetical protein CM1200mP34_3180 [Verrucomicrobiales bacterium]